MCALAQHRSATPTNSPSLPRESLARGARRAPRSRWVTFREGLATFREALQLFAKALQLFAKALQLSAKALQPSAKALQPSAKALQPSAKALRPPNSRSNSYRYSSMISDLLITSAPFEFQTVLLGRVLAKSLRNYRSNSNEFLGRTTPMGATSLQADRPGAGSSCGCRTVTAQLSSGAVRFHARTTRISPSDLADLPVKKSRTLGAFRWEELPQRFQEGRDRGQAAALQHAQGFAAHDGDVGLAAQEVDVRASP